MIGVASRNSGFKTVELAIQEVSGLYWDGNPAGAFNQPETWYRVDERLCRGTVVGKRLVPAFLIHSRIQCRQPVLGEKPGD